MAGSYDFTGLPSVASALISASRRPDATPKSAQYLPKSWSETPRLRLHCLGPSFKVGHRGRQTMCVAALLSTRAW